MRVQHSLVGLFLGAALLAGCSGTESVKTAEREVELFHRQLNAKNFAQIYDAGSDELKKAAPKDRFVRLLGTVNQKLGQFESTKTVGWHDNYGTGGHVATLNLTSTFAKGVAQEQFVYVIGKDQAALAGYHIQSDALLLDE